MANTPFPCAPIEQALPLIYPVSGATSVPVNAGDLIFSSAPIASYVTTSLVPTSTSTGAITLRLGAFIVAPSPIPSPAASYAPSTQLYAVAYPVLAAKTTYAIRFGTSASVPCPLVPQSSGSFTTQ